MNLYNAKSDDHIMGMKRVVLATVGEKKYLSLLANVFQMVYRTGWLGKEYQDIYFLRKFIRPGDWCIDIGAHLGYFSMELSRLVQGSGKVFAVEPMSKFNRVLQRLLQRYRVTNVTVYPVALGGSGEYVEMGIPEVGSMKKFAYARVMESSTHLHYVESEKVKNESGDHLFGDLPRVDFIKCDVEGLEFSVLSSLTGTIRAHHPVMLCEFVDPKERVKLYELFRPLGYEIYVLHKGKLQLLDIYKEKNMRSQNNYFIPEQRADQMRHLIAPSAH